MTKVIKHIGRNWTKYAVALQTALLVWLTVANCAQRLQMRRVSTGLMYVDFSLTDLRSDVDQMKSSIDDIESTVSNIESTTDYLFYR